MKKTIVFLGCLVAVGLVLNTGAFALNLTFGDMYYVGLIDPATPADLSDEASYINILIGLAAETKVTIDLNPKPDKEDWTLFDRSMSTFSTSFPPAGDGSKIETDLEKVFAFNGGYILAKYSTAALAWYVPKGSYSVVQFYDDHGISHYATFVTNQVPEPSILFLLGAGLVGIGAATWRKMK